MNFLSGGIISIILLSAFFFTILKFKHVFYEKRWLKALGITLLTLLYKVDVPSGFVQRGYPIQYLVMDVNGRGFFLNIANFDIPNFVFDVFICAVALYVVNRYVVKKT